MASLLDGWLGYGTAVQANVLTEPSDAAYCRHPLSLGMSGSGVAFNTIGGTIGPATTNWGSLGYAGVFDSPQAGNLLFWMALERPRTVNVSATVTIARNELRFLFPDLRGRTGTTTSWAAGTVVGEVEHHRPVIAGVPLQFSANVMSAQVSVFGTTVVLGGIPSNQPAVGSGQLWNNGGVVSVA